MLLPKIIAINGYIQTTYLVVYPNKLLLLDSGCRCDVEKILNYITQVLQRPLHHLKTVVVTHMHPDHAGGAALLRQKTGCQIVTFKISNQWYAGLQGRLKHFNDLGLTYFVASRQQAGRGHIWYGPKIMADVYVSDGDRLPNFCDWQVLETPGHTDHDLSLWHEQSAQIYTADVILKVKGKFVSPYLITLPDAYRDTLVKIKALAPKTVLMAHGGQQYIAPKVYDELINKVPSKPRTTSNFVKNSLLLLKKAKKAKTV